MGGFGDERGLTKMMVFNGETRISVGVGWGVWVALHFNDARWRWRWIIAKKSLKKCEIYSFVASHRCQGPMSGYLPLLCSWF